MSASPAREALPARLAAPEPDTFAEPGLADAAREVWRRRGTVLKLASGGAVAAAVLAFLLPPVYEAVTTVIPAPSPGRLAPVDQLGARAEELGLAGAMQPNRAAMYPDIVRSRRLLERVLLMSFPAGPGRRPALLLDLVQKPGPPAARLERAVRKLSSQVDAVLDRRTGVLTIRVRSRHPEVAAGVANALFQSLQEFTVHSMTSQAGENRKFIDGRLQDARRDLARAEEALRAFRQDNLRFGNSPRLLLEQGRLTRELRAQEEIYVMLVRQYELATVEEHRDVPVLNVLDPAAVPVSRAAPRRAPMVAVGLLLGAGLGAALVLARREPAAPSGAKP